MLRQDDKVRIARHTSPVESYSVRCSTKHEPPQMQFKDDDGFELIPYHGTRKRALIEIL